jgi:5-methylcytosine-specific restriction endonuclease McrA
MRRVQRAGGRVESDQESLEAMEKVYQRAIDMTVKTGIQHVVDHILAIVNGGAHSPNNLQVITASENKRKWLNHDRHLRNQHSINIENVNVYLNDGIELTSEQYLSELQGEEE